MISICASSTAFRCHGCHAARFPEARQLYEHGGSLERQIQLQRVGQPTARCRVVSFVVATTVNWTLFVNYETFLSRYPHKKRYKNGKKVPNNHVKYFEYPIIKIESIDPEDEGLYQCLARNDFGEVSTNFYLHVRPKRMMQGNGPENAKCYPMDKNTIYVTFNKEDSSNKIQYFIATDTPRDFLSQISIDATSTSFKIDSKKANLIRPLKPFYLYMRNMQPLGSNMIMSALSKPVICATQGIEPRFVKPPHGIFLRWDAPDTGMNITSYTIQFRNSTSDALTFTNEVIGTYETFPTYVSYDEVEKKLEKIPANNTIRSEWSEVQVPGNVTGLLIINTETIDVRILGTVSEDGELFKQDLQYLPWSEIKSSDFSLDPLRLGEVNSRGVEIQWNGLEKSECAEVCSQPKQELIARGPPAGIHCMDMSTSSEMWVGIERATAAKKLLHDKNCFTGVDEPCCC